MTAGAGQLPTLAAADGPCTQGPRQPRAPTGPPTWRGVATAAAPSSTRPPAPILPVLPAAALLLPAASYDLFCIDSSRPAAAAPDGGIACPLPRCHPWPQPTATRRVRLVFAASGAGRAGIRPHSFEKGSWAGGDGQEAFPAIQRQYRIPALPLPPGGCSSVSFHRIRGGGSVRGAIS